MEWNTCSSCGKSIFVGDVHWTVNIHKEKFDGDSINVLDATSNLIFCEACASKRDFDRITVPLVSSDGRGHNGSSGASHDG
jgi:hypothetical protein